MGAVSQAACAAAALLAYVAARALAEPVRGLLIDGGLVRRNYQGAELPVAMGLVIPLASLIGWVGLALLGEPPRHMSLWTTTLFGMGFLGLVDDALGDRRTTGLRGHLGALLSGRPTTGSLKALFGALLSAYAGVALHGASLNALVAAALIAGAANAVNLLDVRPGRALKGYAVLMVWAGLAHGFAGHPAATQVAALSLVPAGGALALWRGDHKGAWMLGDTGANLLGAAAGLSLATAPLSWQLAVLLLLALLHVYSERRSLSALIDAVPLLSRLDRWGR